jgi:hypothetical protein
MASSRNFSLFAYFVLAIMLLSLSCQFFTQPPNNNPTQGPNPPGQENINTPEISMNPKLTLQGQIGGSSYAVDVQGNYAYLGVGPRVYVLDISNPSAPEKLGESAVMPGVVRSVIASGHYVFVAAGKGYLHILDVSDPSQPVEVASVLENSYAQGLALDGPTLYIADNPFGLRVVDVSNPLKPRKIGEIQIPGAASSVDVNGSRAFLAGSTIENGLVALDVSNPAQPTLIGSISIPETEGSVIHAVKVRGDYAYVAAGSPGLIVIDIADPAEPVMAGVFRTAWADGLVIEGNSLYLTDPTEGLHTLDISDPANPIRTGSLSLELFQQVVPGQRNMVIQNGRIFLANGNQGLFIADASTQPALTGRFDAPLPGADWDVVTDNDIAYVIADSLGLYSIDVSDPAQLRQLGFDISRIHNGLRTPRGIAINGQYTYIADINNGFSVYDISNPSDPKELSRVEKPQGMTDVAVSGNYAYVSMQEHEKRETRGMLVYDVSNPSQPAQVGFVNTDHSSWSIAVQENYAYFPEFIEMVETGQPSDFFIFDISSPASPSEAGRVNTTANTSNAMSIAVDGNYAYIGDQMKGLRIFDISNPASPAEVGSLPEIMMVFDLAVVGDKVFTASYGFVAVVDVSNPASPSVEDMYQLRSSGLSVGIDAVGNSIYVADFDGGLAVLNYEK